MRFRITLRGVVPRRIELRGYFDGDIEEVQAMARAVEPFGALIISPAEDDYDPFRDESLRELHHFETEQKLEAALAAAHRGDLLGIIEVLET